MKLASPLNAALKSPAVCHRATLILAPFLYDTATIQKWSSRRTFLGTTRKRVEIPFESAIGIEDGSKAPVPSSVSNKEARIFSLLQDPTYDPTSVLPKEKRRGKARPESYASIAKDADITRAKTRASAKQAATRIATVKPKDASSAERAGRSKGKSQSKGQSESQSKSQSESQSKSQNKSKATLVGNEKPRKSKQSDKKTAKVSVAARSGRSAAINRSDSRVPPEEPSTAEEIDEQAKKNMATISKLFRGAKSDLELWKYLQLCGFERAKALYPRSDHGKKSGQAERPPKSSNNKEGKLNEEFKAEQAASLKSAHPHLMQASRRVFAKTYPHMLVFFLKQLRERFDSSQQAFSLLPALKACGRESYILGASTALYNELILDTWRKYSDFSQINELLREMENAGLEVDYETLDVLNKIKTQGENILRGGRGQLLQQVWQLERIAGPWQEVVLWIPRVKEKLEAEALRKAHEAVEAKELEEWARDQAETSSVGQDHEASDRPIAAAAG